MQGEVQIVPVKDEMLAPGGSVTTGTSSVMP